MASTSLPINVIESSHVAPPPGSTPNHASLPFTYFDIFFLIIPPTERLFFYRYPHSTSHFLNSLLPSLKSSLSQALKTYYYLAGAFRLTPGPDNKLKHYYVEGDAVSFTVAECNGQFEDLASDHARDFLQLSCLAPQLARSGELQSILAVQVTVFPDQGIVIGTSVHHAACDGTSSMQFMHTWAENCLSGASVSSRVPIYDRAIISDPSDLYSLYYNQFKAVLQSVAKGEIQAASIPSDLVLATVRFEQEQIQKLKKLVSAKVEEQKTSFHCSTTVVTFAYVWTCFVKAKRIDSTKRVCFAIAANFRARIQPPAPEEYFGNCIGLCWISAHVVDLIQKDGVIAAAEIVGESIYKLNQGLEMTTNWFISLGELASGMPCLNVAGAPRFKVYDVDFGIGRPTKVEITSAAKTGGMSVAESSDKQGGVEIGIAFPKDEMDRFKKYFFEGLNHLSE